MKEHAIQFGPSGRLSGVLTEPADGKAAAVFGIVNCGFIPKNGPTRVYAQLARELAIRGIASFRFDLGGLGDSIATTEGRLIDRTRYEVGFAVDVMAARYAGAALWLGGICSGAEDSFRYADADERISRTVLIDPFAWRTAGFAWRYQRFRLYRRTIRALGLWTPGTHSADDDWVNFHHMEYDEANRILGTQVGRGSAVHFVYTSGRRELFNHPGQLAKMFPELTLGTRITADFLPEISHTQLFQQDRDLLISTIVRRLTDPSTSPRPR